MKKFVEAEVVELNVNETENGLWPGTKERHPLNGKLGVMIFGSHPTTTPDTPSEDPEDGYKDDKEYPNGDENFNS